LPDGDICRPKHVVTLKYR